MGGTAAALAVTRWLETLLFEVTATDPMSFLAAAGVLLVIVLLASYVPSQRRMDGPDARATARMNAAGPATVPVEPRCSPLSLTPRLIPAGSASAAMALVAT